MPAEMPPQLVIGGGLWFDHAGRRFLGGSRIDLLEGIETHGSITHAAKALGMSYKGAWDAVDAMNNLADEPLVLRTTGGQHGGGSQLTDYGRQVVHLYHQLESGHRRILQRMQAEIHDPQRLGELLRAISLRTSARNQFRGTVKAVHRGAVNADVVLDLGDDLEIFANITNEAVDDLHLEPGREALALIKASFILLSPDAHLRISARNQLQGKVVSVVSGSINSEVKLGLAAGRTLTAIVTNDALRELGLAEGSACSAIIKASQVLVAVND
jgi:molybdate transport system regulatory protein